MSSDQDFDDRDAMQAALEAHGRTFLQSFPASANPVRGIKRKRDGRIDSRATGAESSAVSPLEGDDDWMGFGSDDGDNDEAMSSVTASKRDLRRSDRSRAEHQKGPVVIDFSHAARPRSTAARPDKAFMSSKVSKVRQDLLQQAETKSKPTEDDEQRISDLRNDTDLHRLIHTQLLSSSLDPMMDIKASQKRKAMAGRVLEASGKVKLGVGEGDVRKDEHNKAAKRIREGITKKHKERAHKELEEAKQLGNYHPMIKRMFTASSSQPSGPGKRARGIGSGVGKFVGGTLKLSKSEIASVEGPTGDPQSRRGKNGKRR